MRCECPKDGSFYCAWCAALLARAATTRDTLPQQATRTAQVPSQGQDVSAVFRPADRSSTTILEVCSSPYKSKTEARYADQLAWRVACGEIRRWLYEPVSLRLGKECFYRPDFLVEYVEMMPLHFVEVKGGFIRSRAMEKPRAAATRFPCFTFVLAQWDNQRWRHTRIAAHG